MMEIVKGRAVSRTTTGYADVARRRRGRRRPLRLRDRRRRRGAQGLRQVRAADLAGRPEPDDASSRRSASPATPTSSPTPSVPAADLNPAAAPRRVQRHGQDRAPAPRLRLRAGPQLRPDQQVRVHERREPDAVVPGRRRPLPLPVRPGPDAGVRRRLLHDRLALPPGRRDRPGGDAPHRSRSSTARCGTTTRRSGSPRRPSRRTPTSTSRAAPTRSPAAPRLGAYGAAGLVQSDDVAYAAKQAGDLPDDFVAYRNARATKSWFMLDDEIVVLAAGVGDPAGRAVTTTIDSRIADAGGRRRAHRGAARRHGLVRRGHRPRWPGCATPTPAEGTAVGYVFLDRQPADGHARRRSPAAAASSAPSNPDTPVTQAGLLRRRRAAGRRAAHLDGVRPRTERHPSGS